MGMLGWHHYARMIIIKLLLNPNVRVRRPKRVQLTLFFTYPV